MSLGSPREPLGADDGEGVDLSGPHTRQSPEIDGKATKVDQRIHRHDEVIRLTALGWTREAVADAVDLSARQVDRVRAANRDQIRAIRDDQAEATAAAINSLVPKAIRRLHALIDSPLDNVALGASRYVVDAALRWRDAAEIEQRIRALEEGTDEHPWIAS